MKLQYYIGPRPNFGDDLNAWLWPKILPEFFDDDGSVLFLGIGSILFDGYPAQAKKIVVGSGFGGYTRAPRVDETWDVRFVRGVYTADALGVPRQLAIGDSGILVRSAVDLSAPTPKLFKHSFMPHWESAQVGLWREACNLAGINYIDPRGDVESILLSILQSEVMITEAMHGAIVADALRVPWVAAQPIHERHRSKWLDWASALDLNISFGSICPSSFLESVITRLGQKGYLSEKLQYHGSFLNNVATGRHTDAAARALMSLAGRAPGLSGDLAIERAHSQMMEKIRALETEVGRR